jgi:hypothetical protein
MADVTWTPQKITLNKITPSYNASLSISDTYHIRNNGKMFVHFKKTAAVVCTVTVQTPATLGGLAVAEHTFTVPASTGDVMAGPFTTGIFNDGTQDVLITLSDIDGLSCAAVYL